MRASETLALSMVVMCAAATRAEMIASRAALDRGEPMATCKLQALPEQSDNSMRQPVGLYMLQPPPENPLDNYERTPLGDWRMPAGVERDDPWLRLMLVGPKRPLVIDLAVFIDGRPFRESREAWIDELLAPPAGNKVDASEGTKEAEAASEDVPVGPAVESRDSKEDAAKENATKDTRDTKAGESQEGKQAEEAVGESAGEKASSEGNGKGEAKADVPSGVRAQSRQAPTMRERLQDYLVANGGTADREEIRWMIAEWGSGPAVLLLGPSLSWQRAAFAPLLAVLDRDEDGGLSAAEIAAAGDLLRHADLDANDVLDANELRRAADRPAATPFATGHSLLVPLDAQTEWEELAATLAKVYGDSAGGASGAHDLQQLTSKQADVTLRVDFGSRKKQSTGVALLAVSDELGEANEVVTASHDVVTVDLGGDYVEFSAAQKKADSKMDAVSADAGGAQIAVGAAIDGNPIERLLDRDNDQRLTTRERQELAGLLSALDRDGDGSVGAGEMPLPIRFAVTLGPGVHQLLATPVGAARAIAPRDASPTAPAWFASMDKNSDHDLSRGEFLGTTEQFRQFDADGDGLLSVAEALKLKAGQ